MKRLVIALLLITPLIVSSQNFEKNWIGYFSYNSIKSISQGNDKIYAASENAVFSYDLTTKEINTISSINGLEGEKITTVYYSKKSDLLLIGYETGLIEVIIGGDENILKVVDILEKQSIPPNRKRINHFYEYDGKVYISTQYGISVYDLDSLEFGDTYIIGAGGSQINISQTTVQEPYIFAASDTGIKRAVVADNNLVDYQNWTTFGVGLYAGIQKLKDNLYVLDANNRVLNYDGTNGFNLVESFNQKVVDFISDDELLTVSTASTIKTYSEGFNLEASVSTLSEFNYRLQSGIAFQNNLYLGTTEFGLLIVPFGSNQATQILPDGPIMNNPFAVDAAPGQLWVSFGEVSVNFNPYFPNGVLSKRGISNLKDNEWTNLAYDDLNNDVSGEPTDLVHISINPEKTEEVYMSSFQGGLLKIVDQKPEILYDETNSALDRIFIGNADAGLRIFGSDFDSQGNLWFLQSRTDEGLIKLSPSGQFEKIDLSSIIAASKDLALSKLVVSRSGNVFFATSGNGVVGYNTNSKKFNKIGKGEGSGNLPTDNTRALAFDNQNRLWIGGLNGLRVLFSPGSFFEENANPESQAIIILENGVPQELLFEQSITDIEVDGSNNKWISTATSGVFYLSQNGQETLLRFTEENSPLPSNNVQDISIDPFTGTVYFATRNGLVAYKGSATAPQEDLENVYAYPNPVRPGFSGNVTIDGLTAQANVKITDIEGNLVFETTSEGGSILWDTTAFGKYKVRSGVYMVLITTEDNLETKVSKVMIIR